MNCTTVREGLPEFALGVAPDRAGDIELHVETCAACRKEAVELQQAAAAFAFALAEADEVPPELEDRVVGSVRAVAARPASSHRRSHRAGVVLLAAAIALAGLGAGAVFANRADRARMQAEHALEEERFVGRFGEAVQAAQAADPDVRILTGILAPTVEGQGTGSGLTILSPASDDRILVVVDGIENQTLPLRVSVTDTKGHTRDLGKIRHLDSSGGATFASIEPDGLGGFVDVIVRDARDRIVLRGSLAAQAVLATPTP